MNSREARNKKISNRLQKQSDITLNSDLAAVNTLALSTELVG